MNILFLTTHANTGGITSYVLTLGKALVEAGHKVWIVSSGGDAVPQIEAGGMVHVTMKIRTKSELHPKLWLSMPQVESLIKKEKINIIHAQTRVTQVLGTALSRLTGVALITTCHGFFKPRWFRKKFPCWGGAVIAISTPVAQHLSQDFGVPENKIHLISNGIDLTRFPVANEKSRRAARQLMAVGDVPLIGIIARLSDVKGIDILIEAMPLVLKEIPTAHLMIIGQGPQEDHLKKLTEKLSLSESVHFKNTINQPAELLCGFDVFVMPSLMEGLGLSVMEAQACGIPVVASKVGGLIDLIEDGKSGYSVPSSDATALARRIIDIFRDPNQSKIIAKQARLNIEQKFSSQLMVQKTIELYEQYSRR